MLLCCWRLCLRARHQRWPPHINLLYPFIEDRGDAFQSAAATITETLAHIAPFKVCLRQCSLLFCFVLHSRTRSSSISFHTHVNALLRSQHQDCMIPA
jgi:hypothetical protein